MYIYICKFAGVREVACAHAFDDARKHLNASFDARDTRRKIIVVKHRARVLVMNF